MNVAGDAVTTKLDVAENRVNCVILSEEQQTNPEGLCSAFLGALRGKSCGKQLGVDSQHLWKLILQKSHVEYHKRKQ